MVEVKRQHTATGPYLFGVLVMVSTIATLGACTPEPSESWKRTCEDQGGHMEQHKGPEWVCVITASQE